MRSRRRFPDIKARFLRAAWRNWIRPAARMCAKPGRSARRPTTPRRCARASRITGGIAIDEHSRVRNASGETLAGLYAAGSTTAGLEGRRRDVCRRPDEEPGVRDARAEDIAHMLGKR
ncbi:MAG: FAD-binding protein [Betaproteobacteria bacterium]|nr:FAD-binding protein [Betaproteobacteria bacterium]